MKPTHTKPEKPKILYHYCSAAEGRNAFANLRNNAVYFNAPAKFNDPYDCLVAPYLPELPEAQFKHLAEYASERYKNSPLLKGISKKGDTEVKVETIPALTVLLNSFMQKVQREEREKYGVVCFSERNDNLLMWSHYADNGKGICLAFNTESDPVFADDRVRKVRYSAFLPDIDAYEMSIERVISPKDVLSHKSEDWAYEREWRSFRNAEGAEKYCPTTLEAVYIGSRADDETKRRVHDTVKEKYPNAKLWQGRLGERKYTMKFGKFLL